MANWISSKLKKAETFLQQIDQQAAESLRKDEKPKFDELTPKLPAKTESVAPPIKDQLKKRTSPESNDFFTPVKKDSLVSDKNRELGTSPKPFSTSSPAAPTLTDTDWTQLLSTPEKSILPPVNVNGVSKIKASPKDGRKLLDSKRNQRSQSSISKSTRKLNNVSENKANVGGTVDSKRSSEGEESGSGDSVKRKSDAESRNGHEDTGKREELGEGDRGLSTNLEMTPVPVKVDGIMPVAETKKLAVTDRDGSRIDEPETTARSAVDILSSNSRVGSPSSSDGTSSSDSDSSSTSDSEKERERKAERARRVERILAEKAAAKAVEVIKEHENIVARLEGEKQSLEKILEERAKQQAQEASALQMSMMETMDAVDLEKQKHNNTRMEVFARLTKLETANADLAKSLATTQWNLEVESNQVAKLRQQIELKEAILEDLERGIAKINQSGSSSNQSEALKGVEFEREILEAEYSVTCDKIGQLQEKEKKLKENIEILQKEMEVPTDVEVELKRRLGQLTNHLIQKQTQVESLSSEKATLLFRIETVSRLLEEQKSAPQMSDLAGPSLSDDLEAGTWDESKMKLRPMFADHVHSGGQRLGSLLRQLDAIFSAGAAFVRRNPPAKIMALFYLVCLHFWVSYIFMSHSQASDARSGAVVSLENMNKTIGA